jgi:flagellar biosynthesis/type III secretory pathway protein FliH
MIRFPAFFNRLKMDEMAQLSAEERKRQAQARREAHDKERREYWEILIEGTRDGYEKTRLLFDQRQENLYRRLDDIELSLRDEIRENARTTRIWLVSLNALIVILILLYLWL